ncbi:MAG: ABC transporter substrate-binding protein [Solirubrobacteraceae bacterium]|nr:ABC transporter substrate-binding protein [Solirubrobacteraceae bacterium]
MRRAAALAATAVLSASLAACGSAEKKDEAAAGPSGDPTTLNLAFQADMSVTDPDIFYDVEGNAVTLSGYEGLVRYKPDSTEVEPALAKSWTVSDDGKTYTFKLQDGVTFHDGATMTSKDVKASIERRQAVKGGSSYMVADVDKITTPDDLTVVMHLKQPVGPFLDYLASIWGPKIIGPEALVEHKGDDHSQKYLAERIDGTGPYELAEFNRGREYKLTAFKDYWGTAPSFQNVVIKITPEMGTQRLELDKGDLDVILHSFPPTDLAGAKENKDLQVVEKPSFARTMMYINANKAPLDTDAARKAVAQAIDTKHITESVYGDTAAVATGPYPEGMLADQPKLDYGTDAPVTTKSASGDLTLAYGPDAGGLLRQAAENIQADLAKIGYKVTLKGVQLPDTFVYKNDPEKAPDLLLLSPVSDAAHPDTWAQPFWASTGGINAFAVKNAEVDKLLPQALAAPEDQADDLYRQIGEANVDGHSMVYIADLKDTFVARADLEGLQHSPAYEWLLTPSELSRSGG